MICWARPHSCHMSCQTQLYPQPWSWKSVSRIKEKCDGLSMRNSSLQRFWAGSILLSILYSPGACSSCDQQWRGITRQGISSFTLLLCSCAPPSWKLMSRKRAATYWLICAWWKWEHAWCQLLKLSSDIYFNFVWNNYSARIIIMMQNLYKQMRILTLMPQMCNHGPADSYRFFKQNAYF